MRDDKESLHPVDVSEMLTAETNGRTRRVHERTTQSGGASQGRPWPCAPVCVHSLFLRARSVFQLCGNIVVQYFAE